MIWEWTGRLCVLIWMAFIALAESAPSPLLPVLCYHRITSHPRSDYDVSREDFSAQMRYLQERGYVSISLRQWVEAQAGGGHLPPLPVVLTFDDGDQSGKQQVLPILKTHGFRGTFFVPTGFPPPRQGRYLTWSQLREMATEGMEIMPHGHSHANLTKRRKGEGNHAYRDRLRREIIRSRELMESALHRPCPFFAYPYGAFDPGVEEVVREAKFTLVLTACPGINSARTHPLRLKRQIIYRQDGLTGFCRKVSACPLEGRFSFLEGEILDHSARQIDIDLPPSDPSWGSPILILDRKPIDAPYNPGTHYITLLCSAPLSPGIHILEVRTEEKESGRWHQDSSLFVIGSRRSDSAEKE